MRLFRFLGRKKTRQGITVDIRPDWEIGWRGLQHTWIRWPLVTLLDRLYPNACWARLCMWSFFYGDTLADALQPADDCMAGRTSPIGCWCGKMARPTMEA